MLTIARCITCRHFKVSQRRPVCAAFPGGIPGRILSGEHDHIYAYPGDGGIRYQRDMDLVYVTEEPAEATA
jgi:hypothetical protein